MSCLILTSWGDPSQPKARPGFGSGMNHSSAYQVFARTCLSQSAGVPKEFDVLRGYPTVVSTPNMSQNLGATFDIMDRRAI